MRAWHQYTSRVACGRCAWLTVQDGHMHGFHTTVAFEHDLRRNDPALTGGVRLECLPSCPSVRSRRPGNDNVCPDHGICDSHSPAGVTSMCMQACVNNGVDHHTISTSPVVTCAVGVAQLWVQRLQSRLRGALTQWMTAVWCAAGLSMSSVVGPKSL
jgi:hypothetical protein